MNRIDAEITNIQTMDNLSVVSFESHKQSLEMVALGLTISSSIGAKVILGVKATHISLAKNISGQISLSNELECSVESIKKGKLLSSVKLRYKDTVLESIITSEVASKMNIEVGNTLVALINPSELSILEVYGEG